MTDQRSADERTMDHFPYFTKAQSSKGHEGVGLPHGRTHVNGGPAKEIITGDPVTFRLQAKDPHGRPMKVEMLTDGQRNRTDYEIHPDKDLVVEWTPNDKEHRQYVQFHLRGEHDEMHRLNSGSDQLVSFEFIAFPRA